MDPSPENNRAAWYQGPMKLEVVKSCEVSGWGNPFLFSFFLEHWGACFPSSHSLPNPFLPGSFLTCPRQLGRNPLPTEKEIQ